MFISIHILTILGERRTKGFQNHLKVGVWITQLVSKPLSEYFSLVSWGFLWETLWYQSWINKSWFSSEEKIWTRYFWSSISSNVLFWDYWPVEWVKNEYFKLINLSREIESEKAIWSHLKMRFSIQYVPKFSPKN